MMMMENIEYSHTFIGYSMKHWITFTYIMDSKWLGHTLPKPPNIMVRQTLEWNPQGKWGRWRPRNTWRRTVLEEAKGVNKTWTEIKTDAKNRVKWRILVEALCSAAE